MKKFVMVSVLLLACSGVHGMEVEEGSATLPDDWKNEIREPFSIADKGALLHVAKFKRRWPVFGLLWRSNGHFFSYGQLDIKVVDPIAASTRKGKDEGDGDENKLCCDHPDGVLVAGRSSKDDNTLLILDKETEELRAQFKHDGRIIAVCWSKGGGMIATGGGCSIRVKSVIPLLLATHQLKKPTAEQFFLLRRLQEKLLKEKKSFVMDQSGWDTLDEMPNVKKLLCVKEGRSKKNPTWKVELKKAKNEWLQAWKSRFAEEDD